MGLSGHDPALLYDPAADTFTELAGRGIPLGIDAGWRYETHVVPRLPAGAILALGTDGIWEARGPDGAMYGKERLKSAVRAAASRDAAGIVRAVLDDLETFLAGEARHDDVTLVVVKASALVGEKEDA